MTRKNWIMLIVFVVIIGGMVTIGILVDAYADIVFGSGTTFSWSGKLLLYTHPVLVLTFVLVAGYIAGYFIAHVWGIEQPTPTPGELGSYEMRAARVITRHPDGSPDDVEIFKKSSFPAPALNPFKQSEYTMVYIETPKAR